MEVNRLCERSSQTNCCHRLGKSVCSASGNPSSEDSLLYLRNRAVVLTSSFFMALMAVFSVFLLTSCCSNSSFPPYTSIVLTMFKRAYPSPSYFSELSWAPNSAGLLSYLAGLDSFTTKDASSERERMPLKPKSKGGPSISSVRQLVGGLLFFIFYQPLQYNNYRMIESRVSQLLKQSRSRHSIVISPELRRASAQYQAVRKESRATREDLRRLASEERYLQALNQRLQKGVQQKKRELMGAESVRARYQADLRRKERLEALKREELKKNQNLASRIKEERKRRINAVKKSIFEKQGRGQLTRWQKQKLREERWNTEESSLYQNRKRVEDIVEFQCNLKESYIRKKESMNSKLTSVYRHQIDEERKSIALKRSQTDQIKQKLKSLTQGTARRLAQMNELAKSIRKLKPSTPAARSILVNPHKILQKSRCYTQTGSVYDSPHTDSSLFISNHEH